MLLIGARLQEYRRSAGLNQEEFAEKLGVSRQAVSKWEPDYDAEMNAKITDCILDAANSVCFAFPATLTKEQLLENSSENAELGERNYVNYYIDSEVYMGSSGYHFEFNDTTNQLEEMSISWLP